MKFNVLDYTTADETVTIVSLKGYNTATDIPEVAAETARVVAESVDDLHSLGQPVLDALWAFKAKKGAEKPADKADVAEVVWSMLNPPPKAPRIKAEKNSGQKELQSPTDDGTSSSVAGEPGVKKGRKNMAKVKKANKKAAKKNGSAKKSTGPRGVKTLKVKGMLERKSGCTRAQVLEATGWTAVSMQQMAKNMGLKLQIEKVAGKPMIYFGS